MSDQFDDMLDEMPAEVREMYLALQESRDAAQAELYIALASSFVMTDEIAEAIDFAMAQSQADAVRITKEFVLAELTRNGVLIKA